MSEVPSTAGVARQHPKTSGCAGSGSISVVIPTYGRGQVVVDTATALLALPIPPAEIVLVDQTRQHDPEVEQQLDLLQRGGKLRWLRSEVPSIPRAMNRGLLEARGEVVLFLDDDIVPDAGLVEWHSRMHETELLVAGMVLQPGQQPERLGDGDSFRFTSDTPAEITEFMGGNFSVKRSVALGLGGFDENFVGAAYRFEAEFARRFVLAHGPIRYEPRAIIHHLQVSSGGTRAHGHHLRTLRPDHSVGAYYCLLRAKPPGWIGQLLWRPIRSVRTRHHLRHPWWIPLTLLAELRGLAWALLLIRGGPRLIDPRGLP